MKKKCGTCVFRVKKQCVAPLPEWISDMIVKNELYMMVTGFMYVGKSEGSNCETYTYKRL